MPSFVVRCFVFHSTVAAAIQPCGTEALLEETEKAREGWPAKLPGGDAVIDGSDPSRGAGCG
jgi:hypothetical protein